jgi:hypothetical protein
MATPLTPAGVKVQGNIKSIFVPTLDMAAPSLAVLTGAGALEITNILYADSGRYAVDSATGAAPRRLGTSRTWQQFGTATESFNGSLRYTIDPQGAAGSDGKKAYEKFTVGTTGYIFEVPGIDTDADLAVGDWGRAIPVKFGDPNIIGDPTDEFAEFTVEQAVIVTAPGAGALVQIVA